MGKGNSLNNNSALVAMLAGGLQGYASMKNEQQIREEQRAARVEQLEIQKQMIQMQKDQNAWQQTFQTTGQTNAEGNTDEDRKLKQQELDNQGRLIDAQIKALGGRPGGGPGGRPRGPGGPGGGSGEFGGYSSYSELLEAEQKYSESLAKSLAGREDFQAQYDNMMFDWRVRRGLINTGQGGAQQQPAADPPGYVPSPDPTVDAIRKRKATEAANAARIKNQANLSQQGGSMLYRELQTGGETQADIEAAALDPSSPHFLAANAALALQAKDQMREPYRAPQRKVIPGGYGVLP
jgi:type II secretory pathway pseudopilin PulG